jgi:Flp pilus assembly pilin Flp
MMRRSGGASMVEYVVLLILIAGLIGGALLALTNSVSGNISNIYNQLGS